MQDVCFYCVQRHSVTCKPADNKSPGAAPAKLQCARTRSVSPPLTLEESMAKRLHSHDASSGGVGPQVAGELSSVHQARELQSASPAKLLYSIEDAAGILSLTRTRLYGLIRSGELHVIHVGKRSLLSYRELEQFCVRLEAAASER